MASLNLFNDFSFSLISVTSVKNCNVPPLDKLEDLLKQLSDIDNLIKN